MSEARPAWRQQLEQSLAELQALGKQVGEQLGTAAKDASHEAKKTWRELEPRIGEVGAKVEEKLRGATGEAVEHLETLVGEVRSSLKKLRDEL